MPEVESGGGEERLAELTLELTIGDDPAAAPEYQFAEIRSMYVADDQTTWVQDAAPGAFTSTSPAVRIFDADGDFVRYVGGEGDGPGEYRRPYGIADLPDGRVAVRDMQGAGRILVYTGEGDPVETWMAGSIGLGGLVSIEGGPDPIRFDSTGRMWLFALEGGIVADRRRFYVRLRVDGTVVDTVTVPAPPTVERVELRLGNRGFFVPFQPAGLSAWHPSGRFAMVATDEYRVWWADDSTGVAERDVPPIPVSEEERVDARSRLTEEVRSVEGGEWLRLPEIPSVKPPLRGIQFTDDGRLLALVSMPSELRDGEWMEPLAYHVFGRDGAFTARIVLPDGFNMLILRDDSLWGVFSDEYDVESIRRYRIAWP